MQHVLAISLLITAVSCTADRPGMQSEDIDAGPADVLAAPRLETTPAETPMGTMAVRGTTDGQRVVVRGVNGSQIVSVLPSGTFCVDAELTDDQTNTIEVLALSGSGEVSEPVTLVVARNASAPTPPNPTCSGAVAATCTATETSCEDEKDDDCDGAVDVCDSDCTGCVDDMFEPNDGPSDVPALLPGTYDLSLCPCRSDWFAFHVRAGQRIQVHASFSHEEANVNMRLYPAPSEFRLTDTIVSSISNQDEEEIDWRATATGTYYLNVYAFSLGDESEKQGNYTLTVE